MLFGCCDRTAFIDPCFKIGFCNNAYALGERMHVCRDRGPKYSDDRFVCICIPNCPPIRRRCCFC